MTTSREAFLERVRRAVQQENRAGRTPVLPERGNIGYQGAGADAVRRFADECTAAGGNVHLVPDGESAAACVVGLIQAKQARRVLVGRGDVLDSVGMIERLRVLGLEVVDVGTLSAREAREPLFAADLGISGVDQLIAETGSLAILACAENPRSLSLLPPVHIAIADAGQLLPDLFDLFGPEIWGDQPALPSCLSLITGPSKTGDIELRLVTGVHGPGEVHVVLIAPHV
jgi:L-lactate utilization protein LutC